MIPLSFYSLLLLLENNLIFMNQSQLLPGQILNISIGLLVFSLLFNRFLVLFFIVNLLLQILLY